MENKAWTSFKQGVFEMATLVQPAISATTNIVDGHPERAIFPAVILIARASYEVGKGVATSKNNLKS